MTVKHKYKLVWRIMLLAILSVVLLAACATKPQQVAQSTATVQQATPTPAVLPSPTALLPATVPPTSPAQATPPPPAINTPSPVAEATPATTDADPLEGQALVEALRRGGYVIFFRHARTDFSQPDSDRQNLEDCGTQRNLSEAGRADAHAIGEAFTALRIPVGQVLSSPYCRTRDTAQLTFDRVAITRDLVSTASAQNEAGREQLVAVLRTLLSTAPASGTNTVLISHNFNLQQTADIAPAEGEAVIFAPLGANGWRVVSRVKPEAWATLVQEATPAIPEAAAPSIQEYPVPNGSHPHDVAPAPDGTVWYTAQASGELGRLDPATGATRHIALGTGSAPHGVIVGPDGAPWVTDSGLNAIVRVDPATEAVQRFPIPRERTNLNTATFDGRGVLWFTGQNGFYGRLDPQTGTVEAFDAPRGRGPYGITTTPDGAVYYVSLAGNHLARIDPHTGTATPLDPPTAAQGARRVWSDGQGRIWISEWSAGQLAMYDPATDAWQEWRLPGDKPLPYAVYVDERDMVWLSDFATNALVRFDPAMETFASFALPTAGASVRQILGRPGEVWAAESSTDKLVVLRTQ